MTTRFLAALAVTLGLATTARAQEEPPPPPPTPSAQPLGPSTKGPGAADEFGHRGQFVVGVDVPFQKDAPQLALVRSSIDMGGEKRTIIVVRPSLDYFVASHTTVGGSVGYARGDVAFGGAGVASVGSVTELSVGVRAGYDLPMTALVSIWARVELIYAHLSGTGRGSGYDLPVIVNVPVLFHPATHFFLGAGPTFSRDLFAKVGGVDSPKDTNYGLQGIIGGYLGGS